MIELPSEPVDCSDLFVRIENNAQAIAFKQVTARLNAFRDAVSAKDGNKYQSWKKLPVAALKSLSKKLDAELVAMPPERVKAIAPQIEPLKSMDEFF